ncbi:MAG: hypothetical protein KKD11_06845 [Candidatus Omnitrophica bacterium]|nr:hypothetical protein [Candidatus Omnitrophota bacterium]
MKMKKLTMVAIVGILAAFTIVHAGYALGVMANLGQDKASSNMGVKSKVTKEVLSEQLDAIERSDVKNNVAAFEALLNWKNLELVRTEAEEVFLAQSVDIGNIFDDLSAAPAATTASQPQPTTVEKTLLAKTANDRVTATTTNLILNSQEELPFIKEEIDRGQLILVATGSKDKIFLQSILSKLKTVEPNAGSLYEQQRITFSLVAENGDLWQNIEKQAEAALSSNQRTLNNFTSAQIIDLKGSE